MGLNQRASGAQKTLLVGVQNRHQRYLRQSSPSRNKLMPISHVELAPAQPGQQLGLFPGFRFGVKIAAAHVHLGVVAGQISAMRLVNVSPARVRCASRVANLPEQIVDLALDGANSTSGSTSPVGG